MDTEVTPEAHDLITVAVAVAVPKRVAYRPGRDAHDLVKDTLERAIHDRGLEVIGYIDHPDRDVLFDPDDEDDPLAVWR